MLEDSFAVQDSGLHALATTYSPADVDRAAAFLAAKAVEVPLFWTMLPESRSVYRLLDLQPEHGYRALAAPGPLTENGNDHAQDTKVGWGHGGYFQRRPTGTMPHIHLYHMIDHESILYATT